MSVEPESEPDKLPPAPAEKTCEESFKDEVDDLILLYIDDFERQHGRDAEVCCCCCCCFCCCVPQTMAIQTM